MSERAIAEGIVNRWIAAFRDDLSGKNARERLVDLIHAALAAKDAEIARLREGVLEKLQRLSLGCYDARNFRHEEQVISAQALDDVISALAETPAAPEMK